MTELELQAKIKAPTKKSKIYTIIVSNDTRSKEWNGTIEDLTSYFSYTLEIGNSIKKSVKRNPTTIKSLVSNLQKAFSLKESAIYNRTFITLKD